MPLFEYRCSACAHLEEVLQKHSDPAPEICPKCGAQKTLAKELSLSAFHLKGGGWYKDLYASSSSSSPSDTKTETKAAAPAAAPAAASSSSSSSSSQAA